MSIVKEIERMRYLVHTIRVLSIKPTVKELQEQQFLINKFSGADITGMLIEEIAILNKKINKVKEQRDELVERFAETKKRKNIGSCIAEIQYHYDRELEFIK